MARKKTEIQAIRSGVPIYPIGVAGKLLNVHPRTLRIYEQESLIKPAMAGNRRIFSADDIRWVTCLRTFIHEEGISIPGLKKLLDHIPCWEVAGCPAAIHERCAAKVERTAMRAMSQAGEKKAAGEEGSELERQKREHSG
ncbi:MAG: MerR family transcriptional regulator [Desulfobulbus sp.]|nr:MerR family transcriptional regulator [Desulfobulbus sp.]